MAKEEMKIGEIVVFQSKTGAIELKGDFRHETIWATQADIVKLYGKDQSVISRHIASIFKDKEVDSKSNMQKMHITNSDKPVVFYGLDIILAVGYRTNSKRAIEKSMTMPSLLSHCSLTALSLLIAVSDPKEKDKMIKIVTNLLAG